MRKAIYLLFFLVWLCPAACMAQGLHFGLKAGVLGNKADIQGISNRVKTENMTGFQVGPMLQYQTGFYGLTLDFSLLYVQRGVKLTNTSNDVSADIKTQSIDIPIELKWEMGLSDNFDLFLGIGPSFSFLVNEDNWGRKLVHIAVDAIDKDLSSMGWRHACLLRYGVWRIPLIRCYSSSSASDVSLSSRHLRDSDRLQWNAIP